MRRWQAVLVIAMFFLPLMPAASACPSCREALMEPGKLAERRSTASGYATSVALMLAVPATLVGGTTALLLRAHRRKKRVVIE